MGRRWEGLGRLSCKTGGRCGWALATTSLGYCRHADLAWHGMARQVSVHGQGGAFMGAHVQGVVGHWGGLSESPWGWMEEEQEADHPLPLPTAWTPGALPHIPHAHMPRTPTWLPLLPPSISSCILHR